MKTSPTKLKVQLIDALDRRPYVGNGYRNRNGTLTVRLDDGVTLKGGQRLYVRPAAERAAPPTLPAVMQPAVRTK